MAEGCIYIFRIIIRFISKIDYYFRKLVEWFIPYQYKRIGSCKQCGKCCKEILIYMETRFLKMRPIRNFAVWWNKYFNGLRLIGCLLDEGIMVYTCKHITAEGKCGWYSWRAQFCREYPRNFKYFEVPTTLKGCGYKFEKK